jgi:3'-phosphoadenosine 5'-phosphosulfate sulfotransferase (PAPS reductase)/FAD synthetase
MPGAKPSATDIDIGFRLLGRVERLRGFLSIGCVQCTRVTAPGEAQRAGRGWWEEDETRECGLNLKSGRLVRAGA